MHKLILTGSTGKTGKHFIKLLSRTRYSGKILIFKKKIDEKKYNKNKVKSLNIKYIKCDINKIHILKKNLSLYNNPANLQFIMIHQYFFIDFIG